MTACAVTSCNRRILLFRCWRSFMFEVKCIVLQYFDFISTAVFCHFHLFNPVFLSTAVCFCSDILIDCRWTVANTGNVVFST